MKESMIQRIDGIRCLCLLALVQSACHGSASIVPGGGAAPGLPNNTRRPPAAAPEVSAAGQAKNVGTAPHASDNSAAAESGRLDASCDELVRIEAKMNGDIEHIVAVHQGDVEFIDLLRTSQREWLEYRRAYIDAVLISDRGPSGETLRGCVCSWKSGLTRDRIQDVSVWLEPPLGSDDVCAGSTLSR